ncbi:hypothetical protein J6590_003960 [Homalodisca vitripennis]|nr:hypothetical protein J6590_003960 [Homalodisca vitripennis]
MATTAHMLGDMPPLPAGGLLPFAGSGSGCGVKVEVQRADSLLLTALASCIIAGEERAPHSNLSSYPTIPYHKSQPTLLFNNSRQQIVLRSLLRFNLVGSEKPDSLAVEYERHGARPEARTCLLPTSTFTELQTSADKASPIKPPPADNGSICRYPVLSRRVDRQIGNY